MICWPQFAVNLIYIYREGLIIYKFMLEYAYNFAYYTIVIVLFLCIVMLIVPYMIIESVISIYQTKMA